MKKLKFWLWGIFCMAVLTVTAGLCIPATVRAAEAGQGTENIDTEELLGDVKDKLSEAVSEMDPKTVKEIFRFASEKISDGSLDSEEGLKAAIQESE